MKQVFVACSILFALKLFCSCANGISERKDNLLSDMDVAVDVRIYDIVPKGDTLLIVCDPDGLFFGQPLAEKRSEQWIDSVYTRPGLRTMSDEEMYPHEDGVCTCGNPTYTVVGENDMLQFAWYSDESGNGWWEYTWGSIKDTLVDFAGMRVGMDIDSIANRWHIPENANIGSYAVIHLVAPDLFNSPIVEKLPNGCSTVSGHTNLYDFNYTDAPRIEYAGVELVVEQGRITEIHTGWYNGRIEAGI